MGSSLLIIYVVLVALAVIQVALVALQVWEHRRFTRSRLGELEDFQPSGRAMIFAPCKGIDAELDANLSRLFDQDYDDYEITFIVQSESDPVLERIRRLIARNPQVAAHVIVAGPATDTGQKVHNLRVATEHISPAIDYLVFVDSDARPRRQWLRALVGRLGDPTIRRVGAVTGYRWMVPSRPTLANHLIYGINCGIIAMFGPQGAYPVWGGSWAIRRDMFEAIDLRQHWRGTLSDDLVAGKVLHEHNRVVVFEPAAVVTSPLDNDMRQAMAFLRRQYLIGRFYSPMIWTLGLTAAVLPNLAWWTSVIMLVWMLAAGAAMAWIPAVACAALWLVNFVRISLRQSLITVYCPHLSQRLQRARRFDLIAWPLVNAVNALGLFVSALGRHITWRDITYRLSVGGQTQIVDRDEVCLTEPVMTRRRAA